MTRARSTLFLTISACFLTLMSPVSAAGSVVARIGDSVGSIDVKEADIGVIHDTYKVPDHCLPTPTNIPNWDTSDIADKQFYKDWIKTTTSLCINLTNAEKDNENHYPSIDDGIVWRGNDHRFLFRASGGNFPSAADVLAKGFIPFEPDNGSLALQPDIGEKASGLTSTTYSATTASTFGKHLYVLKAPGGIDVDRTVFGQPARWEDEIAFAGGLDSRLMHGVLIHDRDKVVYRYVVNPKYHLPRDEAKGFFNLNLSTTGAYYDQTKFTLNGEPVGNGMQRIKTSDTPIQLEAWRQGPESTVPADAFLIYISGLGQIVPDVNEDISCLYIPGQMQIDQNMIVQFIPRKPKTGTSKTASKKSCLRLNSEKMRVLDIKFTEGGTVADHFYRPLAPGKTGEWTIHAPGAGLLSSIGSNTGSDAQAMHLNAFVGTESQPSSISQKVFVELESSGYRKSILTFRAGNNTGLNCTKAGDGPWTGDRLSGSQSFKVAVFDDQKGELMVEKDYAIGTASNYLVDADGRHPRMDPDWKYYTIALPLIGREGALDQKPLDLSFTSTGKTGDACGPLISDVQFFSAYSMYKGTNSFGLRDASVQGIVGPQMAKAGQPIVLDASRVLGSAGDAVQWNWSVEPSLPFKSFGPRLQFFAPTLNGDRDYHFTLTAEKLNITETHTIHIQSASKE